MTEFGAKTDIPIIQAMKARQTVTEFILKRLQQDGDKDHVSILDVLLSAHTQAGDTGLKTEEIIDNIITMLFAGSSTSSSTFCNMLMLLGQHPDEIEKLRDEYREAGLLGQGKLCCIPVLTISDNLLNRW